MNVEPPELSEFVIRLGKLEKQNRRLQRGIIAALAAVTAVILMGQAAPSPHTVDAQRFVLKDVNGNVRGWMGIVGKGSELVLGNDSAQPMISLRVSTDSGDLHFYGSRRSGMNLGVNSGSPSISILNADGQGGAGLTFGKNGPSLSLEDGNGFSTVVGTSEIENASDGQRRYTSAASIVLFDKGKRVLWKAP
jgi:hypothetical protein